MRSFKTGLAVAAICLTSNAFAAEPTPTKFKVDGVEREALVFLPSTSSKAKPPVIFAFHGHGGKMHFSARGVAFQNFLPDPVLAFPPPLPTTGLVIQPER